METIKGWSFPLEIDETTGKIKTTTLENDIKQSILILLHTQKGERLYHSDYGNELQRFMFEPLQSNLKKDIQKEIENCIKKWEKRVLIFIFIVFNIRLILMYQGKGKSEGVNVKIRLPGLRVYT